MKTTGCERGLNEEGGEERKEGGRGRRAIDLASLQRERGKGGGEAAALFSTGASQTEYLLAQTRSPSVKEKSSRSYFCEEKYAKKIL